MCVCVCVCVCMYVCTCKIFFRFEVVMAENQASVAALTKRLAQSNAEVERLQHELKRGEDRIDEHRDLLSIMRNNSKIVHEQVRVLMEELDIKKGLVDQLEAESITEMESLKSVFEAKIGDFKNIATKKVAKLQAENDAKTAQNVEVPFFFFLLSLQRCKKI